jgi:terminase small subunit-like protein
MPAAHVGRPSSYSELIANEILERLSNGEPLTKICRDDHMPNVSTVFNWEKIIDGFSDKVTHARACSADHYSYEIIEIAEEQPTTTIDGDGWSKVCTDPAGIQRNKLRIDTRIKLMQMLKRKSYGERTQLTGADGESAPELIVRHIASDGEVKE